MDHDTAEPDQHHQRNGKHRSEAYQEHGRPHDEPEGVGLGLKSRLTEPMQRMQMDHGRNGNEREEDDDYLVGHWGLDEDDARRLPVRQGS